MRKNRKKPLKIGLTAFDKAILILLPLLMVVLMLMTFISTKSLKRDQLNFVYEVLEKKSEDLVIQINGIINDKKQDLELLASFDQIKTMSMNAYAKFINDKQSKMGFEEIFIIDNQGFFYFPKTDTVVNRSGSDLYRNSLELDSYVSDFYMVDNQGPYITICQAIYDSDNKKLGSICGVMVVDSYDKLLKSNAVMLGGLNFVINQRGECLLSSDDDFLAPQTLLYQDENDDVGILKQTFSEKSDKDGIILINGIEYYAFTGYVADRNWVVVSAASIDSLYNTFSLTIVMEHLLTALLAFMCFCLIHMIYKWSTANKKNRLDSLTGVGSRSACATMEILVSRRKNHDLSVLYCDLDRFKYVNDQYGHDVGDNLLKIFADILSESFGDIGFVGRLGGDEFVVFMEDFSVEEAKVRWDVLSNELVRRTRELTVDHAITASHGFGVRKAWDSMSVSEVIKTAENGMYAEKKIKGNIR